MVSVWLYAVLILLTGFERIAEMVISRRNAEWSFERGGVESNQRQLPWMITLHVLFLLGCLAEVIFADRPFIPWLGWPMLVIVLACQAGRYWCIVALGHQWNTRVIVVPGMPRVTGGLYRLPHPNYLIVAVEGIALPLVHTAWVTAIVFTVLNAILLLGFRIPAEDRAMKVLTS